MCYRALITGSSSGIGYQYARHLSKQGWNLDLISQDQKRSLDSKKIYHMKMQISMFMI